MGGPQGAVGVQCIQDRPIKRVAVVFLSLYSKVLVGTSHQHLWALAWPAPATILAPGASPLGRHARNQAVTHAPRPSLCPGCPGPFPPPATRPAPSCLEPCARSASDSAQQRAPHRRLAGKSPFSGSAFPSSPSSLPGSRARTPWRGSLIRECERDEKEIRADPPH